MLVRLHPLSIVGCACLIAVGATLALAQVDRWSAVALSAEAYGWAKGYASKEDAEGRALEACRQRSKKDVCEARSFKGAGCAAVASWSYVERGSRLFGHMASISAELKDAQSGAMTDCTKAQRGCKLVFSFCGG